MSSATDYVFQFGSDTNIHYGLRVTDIRDDWTPPVTLDLQQVAGRPGAYVMGEDIGVRTIAIDVSLDFDTDESTTREAVRDVADWLAGEDTLILFDDTSRGYTARLSGDTALVRLRTRRATTLTFVCADPYPRDTTEDATALVVGDNTITNAGSLPVPARYEVPFTSDATYLKVMHSDGRYIMAGNPPAPGDTPVIPVVSLINLDCDTITGWVTGSATEGFGAGGNTSGTLVASSTLKSFSPLHSGGNKGTGAAAWHGAPLRKVAASGATDFSAVLIGGMDNRTPASSLGSIELYVRDASHNTLALLRIYDAWAAYSRCKVTVRAGGTSGTVHDFSASLNVKDGEWNNKLLRLEVSRVGALWTANVSQVDSTTLASIASTMRHATAWTDAAAGITADAKELEARVSAYDTFALTASCFVRHARLDALNAHTPVDIVHIAKSGDLIVIDPVTREITKDGVRFLDYYDAAGSEWFDLAPGDTTVSVITDGTISGAHSYVRPASR